MKRMFLAMIIAAIMVVGMASTASAEEEFGNGFAPPGETVTCQAVKWYPGWNGSPGYHYQWCHGSLSGWYISYS
jgi:hypothetical protein